MKWNQYLHVQLTIYNFCFTPTFIKISFDQRVPTSDKAITILCLLHLYTQVLSPESTPSSVLSPNHSREAYTLSRLSNVVDTLICLKKNELPLSCCAFHSTVFAAPIRDSFPIVRMIFTCTSLNDRTPTPIPAMGKYHVAPQVLRDCSMPSTIFMISV